MTVETQQNHDRLLCKNGVPNNAMPSANAMNGMKKSAAAQQKDDQYKRFSENVCNVNVNIMENSLASR